MVSLSGNGIPTGAYAWDDRDHLTSQTSGGVTTDYGYSAGGMRVWSQTGSNPKTFYLFDGGLLLGELNAGTTSPIAAYTWGASGLVSERLADSAGSLASGTSLWYAYGPQGETRQLTDATGAVVDSYLYTSYGVTVSATNNARNPFRYGGQAGYYSDLSTTSGNILCTNRWYNPAASRWLSRDPIGYAGGANLYGYCGNKPISRLDPTGKDYSRDVRDFFVGEATALDPRNWFDGAYKAVEHVIDRADSNEGLYGLGEGELDVLRGIGDGLQFWNKPDMQSAGQSFMGDVLLASPFIKKIPGPAAAFGEMRAIRASTILAADAGFMETSGKIMKCEVTASSGSIALRGAGISFRMIEVVNSPKTLKANLGSFTKGTLYSDSGTHYALRVGSRVFDNMTGPQGASAKVWSKATGIKAAGRKW